VDSNSLNLAPRRPSLSQPVSAPNRRPPSLKGLSRQSGDSPWQLPQRLPQSSTSTPTSAPTPAAQANSWRSKTTTSASATARQGQVSETVSVFPDLPSTLQQDHTLTMEPDEELEVVDFSDLGKFVGFGDEPTTLPIQPDELPSGTSQSTRPVASDFFQDALDTSTKSDARPWRRKFERDSDRGIHESSHPAEENTSQLPEPFGMADVGNIQSTPTESQLVSTLLAPSKVIDPSSEYHSHNTRHTMASSTGQQRTPRSATFHKEADLSAWDDAMSRIKGALNGMQATDPQRGQHPTGSSDVDVQMNPANVTMPQSPYIPTKSGPFKEPRWIPPALRVRYYNFDIHSRESFLVTGCEPPHSPDNSFIVQFPSRSRSMDPLNKRQLHLFRVPVNVRWDILSWDPPVEGMNRRDLSVNDVLFRKPTFHKGKFKYRVALPRSRVKSSNVIGATSPRVNLPANTLTSKFHATGAFGKFSDADGMSTWRKPTSTTPMISEGIAELPTNPALDTVSRSPPPELLPNSDSTTLPKPDVSLSAKDVVLVRSRSQPKMPAGSVVAFYRDTRIDPVDSASDSAVNFIVNSELEDALPRQSSPSEKPIITLSSPTFSDIRQSVKPSDSTAEKLMGTIANGLVLQPASECDMPSFVQGMAEGQNSNGLVSSYLIFFSLSSQN